MKTENTTELPVLASLFLSMADNREIETHEIEGLGKVGIKKLSIAARDEWVAESENSTVCLLQNAVCDADTGDLVLKKIAVDRLKELPTSVVDALVEKIFKHNGIKTVKEAREEKQSEELKNSNADQS